MIFIKVYFWGRKCIILHIVLSVRLNEARFLVKQRFVIITDRPDLQRKKPDKWDKKIRIKISSLMKSTAKRSVRTLGVRIYETPLHLEVTKRHVCYVVLKVLYKNSAIIHLAYKIKNNHNECILKCCIVIYISILFHAPLSLSLSPSHYLPFSVFVWHYRDDSGLPLQLQVLSTSETFSGISLSIPPIYPCNAYRGSLVPCTETRHQTFT